MRHQKSGAGFPEQRSPGYSLDSCKFLASHTASEDTGLDLVSSDWWLCGGSGRGHERASKPIWDHNLRESPEEMETLHLAKPTAYIRVLKGLPLNLEADSVFPQCPQCQLDALFLQPMAFSGHLHPPCYLDKGQQYGEIHTGASM